MSINDYKSAIDVEIAASYAEIDRLYLRIAYLKQQQQEEDRVFNLCMQLNKGEIGKCCQGK